MNTKVFIALFALLCAATVAMASPSVFKTPDEYRFVELRPSAQDKAQDGLQCVAKAGSDVRECLDCCELFNTSMNEKLSKEKKRCVCQSLGSTL